MTGSSDATPAWSSQEPALGTQSRQNARSRVDPAPSVMNPCFSVGLSRGFQPGSEQATIPMLQPCRVMDHPACQGKGFSWEKAFSAEIFFSNWEGWLQQSP